MTAASAARPAAVTATARKAATSIVPGTARPRTVTPIVTPTGRDVCSTPEAIPLRSVGTWSSASCVSGVTASPVPSPAIAIASGDVEQPRALVDAPEHQHSAGDQAEPDRRERCARHAGEQPPGERGDDHERQDRRQVDETGLDGVVLLRALQEEAEVDEHAEVRRSARRQSRRPHRRTFDCGRGEGPRRRRRCDARLRRTPRGPRPPPQRQPSPHPASSLRSAAYSSAPNPSVDVATPA